MRRFLPAFLLALAAFLPFSVGCDLEKKHDGADASVLVAVVDAGAGLPTATPTDTAMAAPTAVPTLGTATPTPTAAVHVGDAGKAVVKADAAAPAAPAAPGFPTALPPFTGIPGIDAGMFKLPDGGIKPPWVQ